jgi:hypothetical protein
MMLGRRKAPTLAERAQRALWPRRSWRRSFRYMLLRLTRLDATTHAVALGVSCGVFASFLPVLGGQMLFAGTAAWLLRASVAAAMVGTFVGGPITYPLMWIASYELGRHILGEGRKVSMAELWEAITTMSTPARAGGGEAGSAGDLVLQVMKPMAVGAVPLGLVCAAIFYVMVMRAVRLGRKYR